MKKKFVEPAMHRIELNLRENIAASVGSDEPVYSMGYYFTHTLFQCTIVTTGKYLQKEPMVTEAEAEVCQSLNNSRSLLRFYSREEVLPHFKR